jgi:hypothetical protein
MFTKKQADILHSFFSLIDSLKFFNRLRACKETADLILEAVKKY